MMSTQSRGRHISDGGRQEELIFPVAEGGMGNVEASMALFFLSLWFLLGACLGCQHPLCQCSDRMAFICQESETRVSNSIASRERSIVTCYNVFFLPLQSWGWAWPARNISGLRAASLTVVLVTLEHDGKPFRHRVPKPEWAYMCVHVRVHWKSKTSWLVRAYLFFWPFSGHFWPFSGHLSDHKQPKKWSEYGPENGLFFSHFSGHFPALQCLQRPAGQKPGAAGDGVCAHRECSACHSPSQP
ncbi:Follicle-stimulating hormone receptor, partial [Ophiophagus hannah]